MNKNVRLIITGMIIGFFIFGLTIFVFGFKHGAEIAVQLSKPENATGWSTSNEQINLVTYGICALGGLWIVIAHVFLVFLLKHMLMPTVSEKP